MTVKHEMLSTKIRRRAEKFQQDQLEFLSCLPVSELAKFPKVQDIDAPGPLSGRKFTVERTRREGGGFEIAVVHFLTTTWEERPDLDFIGFGRVRIGPARDRRWFDVTPNGRIEWPVFEDDPDD
jgi:hypothetical protein